MLGYVPAINVTRSSSGDEIANVLQSTIDLHINYGTDIATQCFTTDRKQQVTITALKWNLTFLLTSIFVISATMGWVVTTHPLNFVFIL